LTPLIVVTSYITPGSSVKKSDSVAYEIANFYYYQHFCAICSYVKIQKPSIPKKYLPEGFDFIHEDRDLIIVNKHAGKLSVAALWNKNSTVHSDLNNYVRKGNPKAKKVVYVVHRLDQATSGLMVFAKSEAAQQFLKNNWSQMKKNYLTIVHGHLPNPSGLIESYLSEDDDYHVHSSTEVGQGKLARTEYLVLKQNPQFSVVKINLLTGKKIRSESTWQS